MKKWVVWAITAAALTAWAVWLAVKKKMDEKHQWVKEAAKETLRDTKGKVNKMAKKVKKAVKDKLDELDEVIDENMTDEEA